jgi:hypothetical protein
VKKPFAAKDTEDGMLVCRLPLRSMRSFAANLSGSRVLALRPVTPNYGQLRLITPSKSKNRLAAVRNSRIPAKPGQEKAFAAKERKERTDETCSLLSL